MSRQCNGASVFSVRKFFTYMFNIQKYKHCLFWQVQMRKTWYFSRLFTWSYLNFLNLNSLATTKVTAKQQYSHRVSSKHQRDHKFIKVNTKNFLTKMRVKLMLSVYIQQKPSFFTVAFVIYLYTLHDTDATGSVKPNSLILNWRRMLYKYFYFFKIVRVSFLMAKKIFCIQVACKFCNVNNCIFSLKIPQKFIHSQLTIDTSFISNCVFR